MILSHDPPVKECEMPPGPDDDHPAAAAGVQQIVRCPDCKQILLIIGNAADPGLADELATKVDGHECAHGQPC